MLLQSSCSFAFILIPSQEIGTPDLITSNGHDATILGDVLSFHAKKNLTLIELFEKSEEGVVKIKVERIGSQQILVVWALVSFMIILVILLQTHML